MQFSLIKRSIRFWWQRRVRGWDDSETWSLDHSLAKLILPRLKRYKEVNIAIPGLDITAEQWDEMLDKMIASFTFYASDDRWSAHPSEYEKHQEGLSLFADWYGALWW